uniref:Uncharacterized protein n=1 Tax=Rhizophora mucronata TaxID=61149 RepID=A0A2P2NIZ2_RHIMU
MECNKKTIKSYKRGVGGRLIKRKQLSRSSMILSI